MVSRAARRAEDAAARQAEAAAAREALVEVWGYQCFVVSPDDLVKLGHRDLVVSVRGRKVADAIFVEVIVARWIRREEKRGG